MSEVVGETIGFDVRAATAAFTSGCSPPTAAARMRVDRGTASERRAARRIPTVSSFVVGVRGADIHDEAARVGHDVVLRARLDLRHRNADRS